MARSDSRTPRNPRSRPFATTGSNRPKLLPCPLPLEVCYVLVSLFVFFISNLHKWSFFRTAIEDETSFAATSFPLNQHRLEIDARFRATPAPILLENFNADQTGTLCSPALATFEKCPILHFLLRAKEKFSIRRVENLNTWNVQGWKFPIMVENLKCPGLKMSLRGNGPDP